MSTENKENELDDFKTKILQIQEKIGASKTKREQLGLYKEYTQMLRHLLEFIFYKHNLLEHAYDDLQEKMNKNKEYRQKYYIKNKEKIIENQKKYNKRTKNPTTVNFE